MPIIALSEPVSARYIYIDPDTNIVHLMVPLVNGQEISTDNTCRSGLALKDFFQGGALQALNAYKEALVFDIALLVDSAVRRSKQERLAQIEAYIQTVAAMRHSYGDAIIALLAGPSNVYSFQLRPRIQDHVSRVVNPVFTVERRNALDGTPLSALYNAMDGRYGAMVVAAVTPRTQLKTAALGALLASASFEKIQQVLGEQSVALFGLTIDFTRQTNGMPATKEAIDTLMGLEEDVTLADYIDAFVGACAGDIEVMIPTPPFYSIPAEMSVAERVEKFSIITQFFLANLNVYCKARGISTQNFGEILDNSVALSNELVTVISTALTNGEDVEQTIYNFFNTHPITFHLSRLLNADDLTAIRGLFERTYRTVAASLHKDEFMLLDKDATGDRAICAHHQGAICVDFARIVDLEVADMAPEHFRRVLAAPTRLTEVPHRNEFVVGEADIEIETLIEIVTDEQFRRLPEAVRDACRAHPNFLRRHFVQYVAEGKQEEAEALLTATPDITQTLLRTPGIFTDYSGRTFNCTAYEYAYWAKDTHMCRMLERLMDDETKALMLARIDENDKNGLTYQQDGEEHRCAHFDFTPLIQAYQHYVDNHGEWRGRDRVRNMLVAWMGIGRAQCNLPAHVAQEYCRPDRPFVPVPEFDEVSFPRQLTFYNSIIECYQSLFPLTASNFPLGYFVLVRTALEGPEGRAPMSRADVSIDLEAISRLNQVRSAELISLRERLNPPALLASMVHGA